MSVHFDNQGGNIMVNSSRNLTPEMLRKEQETTLASPVMKINPLLKIMIVTMDIIYGKKRTLPKFRVIEVLAGFPYRAWSVLHERPAGDGSVYR